jgi:cold shock CspA family protein
MIKQVGVVRYYDEVKGLGKIENEFGEEILVYQNSLPSGIDLKPGLKVLFELHQALLIAVNVSIIDNYS